MLAKKRTIKSNGVRVLKTPLFIPSFSSKANVDLQKTYESVESTSSLKETYLVSTYDLYYKDEGIKQESLVSPVLLFLDSGGYEALDEGFLPGEEVKKSPQIKEWTPDLHLQTLKSLNLEEDCSIISFDHPEFRCSLKQQIENAKTLYQNFPNCVKEFLIKPSKKAESGNGPVYLDFKEIEDNILLLKQFDIIGVTDKELGSTFLERLQMVADVRVLMIENGMEDLPIHVFGNLDTITSPLYFLAGADIFDGLSWLKFCFHEGKTHYLQTANVIREKIDQPYNHVEAMNMIDNISYLKQLQGWMKEFLSSGNNFSCFQYNSTILERLIKQVEFNKKE